MTGRDFPTPAVEDIRLMDVLKALSDPGRVKMVEILSHGDYRPCNPESFGLDIQKSTLSHHFKTLREAGITETRVQGRNYDVRLRLDDLEARFPGLIRAVTSPEAMAEIMPIADPSSRPA